MKEVQTTLSVLQLKTKGKDDMSNTPIRVNSACKKKYTSVQEENIQSQCFLVP